MEESDQLVTLALMKGFRLEKFQLDALHAVGLGILQWALGYAFKELLIADFWTTESHSRWEERFSHQLRAATREFRSWARSRRVDHSEFRFTLGKLSISALSGETATAYYKGKAHNTLVVSIWMSELCSELANRPGCTEHATARAACLWGYTQSLAICKNARLILTDSDIEQLEDCRSTALAGALHLWLEGQRLTPSENPWPMTPNNHFFRENVPQCDLISCTFWPLRMLYR